MKAKINRDLLRTLPEGKDLDIYDLTLTGFVLRCRASGRHSYRVTYGRGKSVTIGKVAELTPAQAREQAQVILGDVARGIDPVAERRKQKASTLRGFITDVYGPWVETNRKTGKASTKRLVACFFDELGAKRLPEITPWLVEKWRTKRRKQGRADATINRDVVALKAAINKAVEWGYIDANPISRTKPLKVDENSEPRYLTKDEEARLRQALIERDEQAREARCRGNVWKKARGYTPLPEFEGAFTDYMRPMVLLAINTGMRRGELFSLTWEDIKLGEQPSVAIRGPGAKSAQTRHVPLNAEAVQALTDWRECSGHDSGLVFRSRTGERLDNVNKAWKGIQKLAGLADFRFHDMRHHFASRLVMAGVDLNTVRELLGHADLKMTLRYAHLAPEHKASAVERLMEAV